MLSYMFDTELIAAIFVARVSSRFW